MAPRTDKRHVAYRVGSPDLDPWSIFGTLTLVVFVFAFAFILWQGRDQFGETSHKTPTDSIVLIASPQPTLVSTPSPEPTASPSLSAQLVDTGASNAPAAPTPRPTPAPKPTVTHRPPTAILNVTPKSGTATLTVTADASLSWDPTGIVSYQFIWGDGLSDPPQASYQSQPHRYPVKGTYTIKVIVVNSVGLASSDSTTITVI